MVGTTTIHLHELLEEEKLEELAEALDQLSAQEAQQLEASFLQKLLSQPDPYLRRVVFKVMMRRTR